MALPLASDDRRSLVPVRSRHLACIALVSALSLVSPLAAQPLTIAADDTIEKLLATYKGKRVTVKLGPGDELTGVVKAVTPSVVHLSELAGREFFDAAVDVKSVRAVIVRTRN
jgi:hypothetical protein